MIALSLEVLLNFFNTKTKKWRRQSPREKKKSFTQIREKIMHLSLSIPYCIARRSQISTFQSFFPLFGCIFCISIAHIENLFVNSFVLNQVSFLQGSFLQVSLLKLRDFKDKKFMGTTRRA
ncbi:hypothetical protein RHMOL_Rhmol06G0178000 [Rhododendron molle]|uniref:Uncharacterized protein n=1 Tax=Rhododendron molle TaxID=49168 RepID=A0ACC0NDQ1_RHOML|nr:hypothetical protein RHMOL_Rhmol06G0178000 [Rhododendron molle]